MIQLLLLFFAILGCDNKIKKRTDPTIGKIVNKENIIKEEKVKTSNLSLKRVDLGENEHCYIIDSYTTLKIGYISQKKVNFKAKYISCGKSTVYLGLFDKYKETKPSLYKKLGSITTVHKLIIDKDTVYLPDKSGSNCLQKNDLVKVKATLFNMKFKDTLGDILIIDELIKIVE